MTAEEKLGEIYNALGLHEKGEGGDLHARHNLMGALIDLERQPGTDVICIATIKRVIGQLVEVERIFDL